MTHEALFTEQQLSSVKSSFDKLNDHAMERPRDAHVRAIITILSNVPGIRILDDEERKMALDETFTESGNTYRWSIVRPSDGYWSTMELRLNVQVNPMDKLFVTGDTGRTIHTLRMETIRGQRLNPKTIDTAAFAFDADSGELWNAMILETTYKTHILAQVGRDELMGLHSGRELFAAYITDMLTPPNTDLFPRQ